MSDKEGVPFFHTVDDLLGIIDGAKNKNTGDTAGDGKGVGKLSDVQDRGNGLGLSLSKVEAPDLPLVDRIVIGKLIAAVCVIVGVPLSDERLAALSLVVSVLGGLLLWSDARRRVARNERGGVERAALVEAMIHLQQYTQSDEE